MKIVIVGGVAGGATAAARLRRLDESAEIVLLEREPEISYANCGLPYYIGGKIKKRDALLLQTPEGFRRRYAVDVRVRHEAVAIDRKAKRVRVRDLATGDMYEEGYDRLLLSPGAKPARPPLPGVESKRVFTLRTVGDTFRIDDFIKEYGPKRAVVVGGGFIGVEMAENLVARGLSVTLVEAGAQVLGILDRDMAAFAHGELRKNGVDLRLGEGVRGLAEGPEGIVAELDSGRVEGDMVLLAVGVRPETGLAEDAGLALGAKGAIMVDEAMQTSDPWIWAVGDAVCVTDVITGAAVHVPLAGPANRQGRIAADAMLGIQRQYNGAQGSAILKAFGLTIGATGLNESRALAAGLGCEAVHLHTAPHAGYWPGGAEMELKLVFERGSGRVLGAQLIGGEGVDKRCDVLAAMIRRGATADDLADLELCYAPPYSAANDPVNMAGFMIQDIEEGRLCQFSWREVAALPRDGSVVLLDVRTVEEYAAGHIEGAVNIPVDELRGRLAELGCRRPVYVYCQSGKRSYTACRILAGHGFPAFNLAGGYGLYKTVTEDLSRSGQGGILVGR